MCQTDNGRATEFPIFSSRNGRKERLARPENRSESDPLEKLSTAPRWGLRAPSGPVVRAPRRRFFMPMLLSFLRIWL